MPPKKSISESVMKSIKPSKTPKPKLVSEELKASIAEAKEIAKQILEKRKQKVAPEPVAKPVEEVIEEPNVEIFEGEVIVKKPNRIVKSVPQGKRSFPPEASLPQEIPKAKPSVQKRTRKIVYVEESSEEEEEESEESEEEEEEEIVVIPKKKKATKPKQVQRPKAKMVIADPVTSLSKQQIQYDLRRMQMEMLQKSLFGM